MLPDKENVKFRKKLDAIRQLDSNKLIPVNERWGNVENFTSCVTGGFLRIEGKVYQIIETGKYYESDWDKPEDKLDDDVAVTEYKLFCIKTGEVIHIEWEEDDDIEVYFTIKKYKLKETGLDAETLDDADEVTLDGKTYEYEDEDSEAYVYKKDDESESIGDGVRMYAFEAHDGTFLTIEEWWGSRKSEFEVFTSKQINFEDIEILSTGG